MISKTIELTAGILWGAITALAATIGTTAYVTWEIRKDYLDDLKRQVETYEKSSNWKLPETLATIKLASESLVLNANEKKELAELRKDANLIREQTQKLATQLDDAKSRLSAAERELAQIYIPSTVIELNDGDSKFINGLST